MIGQAGLTFLGGEGEEGGSLSPLGDTMEGAVELLELVEGGGQPELVDVELPGLVGRCGG